MKAIDRLLPWTIIAITISCGESSIQYMYSVSYPNRDTFKEL